MKARFAVVALAGGLALAQPSVAASHPEVNYAHSELLARVVAARTMPNVVGKMQGDAIVRLGDMHLWTDRIGSAGSTKPAGTILKQWPKPGAVVPVGTSVRLIVAGC
jgi:hypothetical protein